jgi:hypothetical protein
MVVLLSFPTLRPSAQAEVIGTDRTLILNTLLLSFLRGMVSLPL